ncbi:MAG: NADH-quinone oxidoreductase subunit NuoH [Proteobacteria bacterium]|nr:NADH-quinone oxidoreductase subunit NuoH [Pseudomonadota bacterium]
MEFFFFSCCALPQILWVALKCLSIILPLILTVAYITYAERKIIGAMQLRIGPNMVGPFGLLQPIADAIKLLHKEITIPFAANKILFILAPILTFGFSLAAWAVIPFDDGVVIADVNVGILYLFAISSLTVYGIILAGWASNSKYAFLGAMRSAAQMISYEVSIGLVIITVLLKVGSLNISAIVKAQQETWFILTLFPMWIIFFISSLAEANRTPFDLPEAEAELVAGYHVEYSSFPFALFFLGEYANMILLSAMNTILFFGGWQPPFNISLFQMIPGYIWFAIKIAFFLFLFIWIRASLPRYRYDQLMRLGWKIFLPISLIAVILVAAIKLSQVGAI